MLARLWGRWKQFAQRVGDFQARLLLTLLYFLLLGPMGMVVRILRDPLRIKHASKTSVWIPKSEENDSLEIARRQF